MEQEIGLDSLFKKVYSVLKERRMDYLLIGGLAAGVLGEPRFTQDADFLIYISQTELESFLNDLSEKSLEFDRKRVEESLLSRGVFRVFLGDYHADFIINALDIGKVALDRAIEVKLFGRKVRFPSPEDLILFKLIAGRELDLLDAKNIYIRHMDKLDKDYLIEWAQKICDEIENMSVWNKLQKLLEIADIRELPYKDSTLT
ncbi:MAG: nucleotidyltransferase [bacterium]